MSLRMKRLFARIPPFSGVGVAGAVAFMCLPTVSATRSMSMEPLVPKTFALATALPISVMVLRIKDF